MPASLRVVGGRTQDSVVTDAADTTAPSEPVVARYRVEPEAIRSYADAVHEHDAIYHDAGAAQQAGFGGIVAPPMFAAVYSAEAVWSAVLAAIDVDAGPVIHSGQELVWSEPVQAGDEVETRAWLDAVVERDPMRLYSFVSESRNQHGREVVRGVWTIVVVQP
jgi:acyl dehydratase